MHRSTGACRRGRSRPPEVLAGPARRRAGSRPQRGRRLASPLARDDVDVDLAASRGRFRRAASRCSRSRQRACGACRPRCLLTLRSRANASSAVGHGVAGSTAVSAPELLRELQRARPSARARPPTSGGAVALSTYATIHSARRPAAIRRAARTSRSLPGSGRTQTRIRSATGQVGLDRVLAPVVAHVGVDALGGAAQRQLAQREQVAVPEEALDRARRLVGHVDLALARRCSSSSGGRSTSSTSSASSSTAVGHGLAHRDAGDLARRRR